MGEVKTLNGRGRDGEGNEKRVVQVETLKTKRKEENTDVKESDESNQEP